MAKVIGASVRWFEGYGNSPELEIVVDDDRSLVSRSEPIWRYVETESGGGSPLAADQTAIVGAVMPKKEVKRWVIAEQAIDPPGEFSILNHCAVSWVVLDERRPPIGGASGGTFALADGSELRSPGGWSGRAGLTNLYLKELGLSDFVLDVIWKKPESRVGMSGHCTLPVALQAISAFLPGVYLVVKEMWGETYFIPSCDPNEVMKPSQVPA